MRQSVFLRKMFDSAIAKTTEEPFFGADPQNSRLAFHNARDIEASVLFFTETDVLELPVAAGLMKRMETVVGAEPNRSGAVLVETCNRLGTRSLGRNVSFEFGFRSGVGRVEVCEAARSCHPVYEDSSDDIDERWDARRSMIRARP